MKLRKTQLAVAVGAALLAGATAVQAQSATVMSRDKDPVVTLYGQVGRALMWADDGYRNKVFHADGESDGTRLGLRGSTQVMPGLRAGFRFEFEIQSNSTDKVTLDAPSHTESSHARERFQEVILQGAWGQLNIGQGEPGADNTTTRDLSNVRPGTSAVDYGGAILWRASGGTGAGTSLGIAPADTHSNQDFDSRYDRFMYTTPTFGGFWVQVSNGQKNSTSEVNELGLWYRGKLAGDIEAAIGWGKEYNGAGASGHNEQIGGSVSWLHTSGFNLTLAYSTQEVWVGAVSRDAEWTYGKVGYKFGPHAVALGYGMGKDQAASGVEGDVMQLGYTWSPARWFDLYAMYQVFTLDLPAGGGSAEDITIGSVGVAVRF